ncbi:hypothetical protein [Nocardia niigatensis]|uniref:hypothetical protein n=1 Tax=Nocardia niigatensis TaxID=209249 RepID=UPI0012F68DE3|nr:hypothetical protein [Nocardia niigatensis]
MEFTESPAFGIHVAGCRRRTDIRPVGIPFHDGLDPVPILVDRPTCPVENPVDIRARPRSEIRAHEPRDRLEQPATVDQVQDPLGIFVRPMVETEESRCGRIDLGHISLMFTHASNPATAADTMGRRSIGVILIVRFGHPSRSRNVF